MAPCRRATSRSSSGLPWCHARGPHGRPVVPYVSLMLSVTSVCLMLLPVRRARGPHGMKRQVTTKTGTPCRAGGACCRAWCLQRYARDKGENTRHAAYTRSATWPANHGSHVKMAGGSFAACLRV